MKNTFLTKYICNHSTGRTWRATACPKLWAETCQEWASRSWRTGACCQEILPNPSVGQIHFSFSQKYLFLRRPGHLAAGDPSNPTRPERSEQLHHHPWGKALLFCSTQVNNPHMTNGAQRQTKQHLWSSLICRSRLGLTPSEVGAQFKGKSCVFRRCDGSRLAPEVKTNKGKTRSQRLRSFSFVSNFPVTSSRGWEKACNERTSWRSAYCILRKPWRQGQENLWAGLFISMKRRVSTKEKRKENSKIQLELLKNEKATKIRTRWKIRIFADENCWITP